MQIPKILQFSAYYRHRLPPVPQTLQATVHKLYAMQRHSPYRPSPHLARPASHSTIPPYLPPANGSRVEDVEHRILHEPAFLLLDGHLAQPHLLQRPLPLRPTWASYYRAKSMSLAKQHRHASPTAQPPAAPGRPLRTRWQTRHSPPLADPRPPPPQPALCGMRVGGLLSGDGGCRTPRSVRL